MDKVAVVTGGAKGIGRALCLRLAEEGIRVVINYSKSKEDAEETLRQIVEEGGEARIFRADVTNSSEVQSLIDFSVSCYGTVDFLINNAGVMTDHSVEEMTDDHWLCVRNTNLSGAFYACRAVIPLMKQKRFGRIVNISSQAALNGSAGHAHYAASKAGLLGLTYSLAKELGPCQITVNAVSPGRIITDMIQTRMKGREEEWMNQTPLRRLGSADDVAHAVSYLVSDKAAYVTGLNLHVNGGMLMG